MKRSSASKCNAYFLNFYLNAFPVVMKERTTFSLPLISILPPLPFTLSFSLSFSFTSTFFYFSQFTFFPSRTRCYYFLSFSICVFITTFLLQFFFIVSLSFFLYISLFYVPIFLSLSISIFHLQTRCYPHSLNLCFFSRRFLPSYLILSLTHTNSKIHASGILPIIPFISNRPLRASHSKPYS